jgi:hypothetical protein
MLMENLQRIPGSNSQNFLKYTLKKVPKKVPNTVRCEFCNIFFLDFLRNYLSQWNSTFFAFSMIIEGTTEKVLQFSMLIMSIFNQNLGFTEKVCIFEHYKEVKK